MTEMTSYPHGVPSWVDLPTTDVEGAVAFYRALFGWETEDMGEQAGHYTMCRLRGLDVAAISPRQPGQGGETPSMWNTYITVDDADAAAKRAEDAGGTVLMTPFDVMDIGRMAWLADPTGATFMVWQARSHIGARLVNEPGTLCWNELNTRDVDSAVRFYSDLFGWTVQVSGEGDPDAPMAYHEFLVEDRSIAGCMQMTEQAPASAPPHWLVYFAVADCDATVATCGGSGGNVLVPPTDIAVGRFAVCQDPQGGVFAVIHLNEPPT